MGRGREGREDGGQGGKKEGKEREERGRKGGEGERRWGRKEERNDLRIAGKEREKWQLLGQVTATCQQAATVGPRVVCR